MVKNLICLNYNHHLVIDALHVVIDKQILMSIYVHFQEEVAKEFGIPVQCQRFWLWAKRQNHTYRPNRPLTSQEETQSVRSFWYFTPSSLFPFNPFRFLFLMYKSAMLLSLWWNCLAESGALVSLLHNHLRNSMILFLHFYIMLMGTFPFLYGSPNLWNVASPLDGCFASGLFLFF